MYLDIYKHSEIAKYFHRILTDNSSFPIIQFCINKISFDEYDQSLINKFKSTFLSVPFRRLKINCNDTSPEILLRIIHLLPNLDSLNVSSLSSIQSDGLVDSNGKSSFPSLINTKIINVNLDKMINLEQVHFLLQLCPCIQYFQVNVPMQISLEILVRCILIQASNIQFCSSLPLSFHCKCQ